jgi:hypothetical protein
MKKRASLYEIFPTLFLIFVITSSLIFLVFFGINNLSSKEKITNEVITQNKYNLIKDKLIFCYGFPLDITKINANPNCLNLVDNNGISIDILEASSCNFAHITNFPYRGSGIIKTYTLPLTVNNNSCESCKNNFTCLSRITFYEDAHLVPLVTKVNITPIISLIPEDININYEFHSVKDPSYIFGEILNSHGENIQDLDSGSLTGLNSDSFSVSTTSFNSGKYELKLKTSHDLMFFANLERSFYFRVINSSTTSILNDIKINPENGTKFNVYNITLNLSDYVNITLVEIAIMNNTDVINLMECNRTSDSFNQEDISYNFIYSCLWYPSNIANINQSYNITLMAENELGNVLVVDPADSIKIIEQTDFDLMIISIKENLENVYTSSQINSLEEKIQDYLSVLGNKEGLTGRLFYLDEDEVQSISGLKLSGGTPYTYNQINTVLTELKNKLDPSYLMILGGNQIFPHAILPSVTSGTDDIYGDNNSDNIPDIPVGRIIDPVLGDINLLIKQFDNFINVHSSGGLDFSNYAANGMNEPWTSATCYNKHVWGAKTTTYAKIGSFACDLSDANNKGFYMHLMHGHDVPQSYVCKASECVCTSFIYPSTISFINTDVWFTMSCYGGKTSNKQTTTDSIVMTFFSNGGSNYIGSTDLNYGGKWEDCTMIAGSLLGDVLIGGLYTKISNYFSVDTRIGDAYIKGKSDYYFYVDPTDSLHNYQTHINILYGDPTLKIKNMW